MKAVRILGLLIAKELRLEWRGRELAMLLLCNGIMLSAIVSAGMSSAVLDGPTQRRLFPVLMWLVFLFSVTASIGRANEAELENRGFEGLLLAGVSGAQMYAAKFVVTTFFLWISFVTATVLLAVGLDQGILRHAGELALIGFLIAAGVSALLVLLVAVASTSRVRGVLVPILAFPLMFPLFFAGIELSSELLLNGKFDVASVWVSVAAGADVLFFLIGVNLFEIAIRE